MPWSQNGNKNFSSVPYFLSPVTCRGHSFAAFARTPEEARAWVAGPARAFGVTNAATMMRALSSSTPLTVRAL